MKRHVCFAIGGILAVALTGCASRTANTAERQPIAEAGAATGPRIGVYDSRSIAVAFAGSPRHEEQLAPAIAAMNEAKAAGDDAAIAKAGQALREGQDQMHRQGFGTAPVDEILSLYTVEIDALKAQYGLIALVSQWDDETLRAYTDVEQFDMTNELIDVIGPNDRQRSSAQSVREHKPLTEAELAALEKHER